MTSILLETLALLKTVCCILQYLQISASTSLFIHIIAMVFSDEDKAVIKNDFMEKNWSAYRICKEHPNKNWNQVSVRRLLKRFQCYGTLDRRSGSGRPRTVTTEENEMIVEELICSQEENPGTHLSPREIEKETGISRSSIQRMVKRRG